MCRKPTALVMFFSTLVASVAIPEMFQLEKRVCLNLEVSICLFSSKSCYHSAREMATTATLPLSDAALAFGAAHTGLQAFITALSIRQMAASRVGA